MGYSTYFHGRFRLNKPLTPAFAAYLTAFCRVRHMKRDPRLTISLPAPLRMAIHLPLGQDSVYYVGDDDGDFGQKLTADIIDYNSPSDSQPGLWCGWTPSPDLNAIEHDGGEKFYNYVEWLEYLIEHFLKPWGYILSGEVTWEGEDNDDRGRIIVVNNVITTRQGIITYV